MLDGIGAFILAIVVIVLNLAFLAVAIWVIVTVLRAMNVIA